MRTSMRLRLSPGGLFPPLAATVERQVGVVAQRDVDDEGEHPHHDALRDVLLDDRDEDDQDHRCERRPVERTTPGRLAVQPVRAALLGERTALDLRAALRAPGAVLGRLAGTAGAIDRAGLGAAVPTLALA